MAIALKQSGQTSSSAVSPTSITPSLGVASTAGNLLLLTVVVTGNPVSITTPANWTLVSSSTIAGALSVALFMQANAPSLTSQAVTITATGGGASASIFEFSGVGPTIQVEASGQANATSNSYGTGLTPATVPFANELLFYVVGFAAATLTPSNSFEWSGNTAGAVSTGGTPNAQIANFWGISPGNFPSSIGGGFSASVVHGQVEGRFFVQGSDSITLDIVGGNAGIYVPTFYQGMIGG